MPLGPTILIITVQIVVFFAAVLIIRAIFSIGRIVRNLHAQTQLLLLIAKKQGVDTESTNRISEESQVFMPDIQKNQTSSTEIQ